MQTIDVVRGLRMPFYPMRPANGRTLSSEQAVRKFYAEIREEGTWVAQPKLNGDRAVLAVVDRRIHVQNRHGGWYQKPVVNARDFLKLPNRTAFDGEVFHGRFCPFEALAVSGDSFVFRTVSEREVVAYQLVRFLGHRWMFGKPTLRWLLKGAGNLPDYDGVVIKRASSLYVVQGSATQVNRQWLKLRWS